MERVLATSTRIRLIPSVSVFGAVGRRDLVILARVGFRGTLKTTGFGTSRLYRDKWSNRLRGIFETGILIRRRRRYAWNDRNSVRGMKRRTKSFENKLVRSGGNLVNVVLVETGGREIDVATDREKSFRRDY